MIDLTGLSFTAVEPSLLEFGGIQRGSLGGPSQNLQRLGNRFAFALALPPRAALNDWTGKIVAAKQEGAIIRIPEPGWTGAAGQTAAVRVAVPGGVNLPIKNLSPGDYIQPGKWISVLHGGQYYAHLVQDSFPADGAGETVLTLTPMLRTPVSVGDLVQIGSPKAQGLLTDRLSWSVGKSRTIAFTLTLEERL